MGAMARLSYGECPCCGREVALTFHHLIPCKMHRRKYFQKHFTKEERNQGVSICRLCHDGVHDTFDEMTLAKSYYTLALLLADETLQRHFAWVAKQKVS